MNPSTMFVRSRNQVVERVERTDVEVTCLKEHDARLSGGIPKRLLERTAIQLAIAIRPAMP